MRQLASVEDQWEAPLEPVPVLVWIPPAPDPLACLPEQRQLRALPDLQRGPAMARVRLCRGGSAVLFERAVSLDDPTSSYLKRRRSVSVCTRDLATGTVVRSGHGPPAGFADYPLADVTADGSRFALLQTANGAPAGGAPAAPGLLQTQVWVAGDDGSTARQLTTIWGSSPFGEGDDHQVQWAPYGASFAVSLSIWHGPGIGARSAVVLFDADTGQETARLEGMSLAGSASWSPDGTRLVVETQAGHQISTVEVASGRLQAVSALPAPRPQLERPNQPRVLGYADDDQLLVVVRRGRTMTLHRTDANGEDAGALLRWTGRDEDMYPSICRMPPGYWAGLG